MSDLESFFGCLSELACCFACCWCCKKACCADEEKQPPRGPQNQIQNVGQVCASIAVWDHRWICWVIVVIITAATPAIVWRPGTTCNASSWPICPASCFIELWWQSRFMAAASTTSICTTTAPICSTAPISTNPTSTAAQFRLSGTHLSTPTKCTSTLSIAEVLLCWHTCSNLIYSCSVIVWTCISFALFMVIDLLICVPSTRF